MASLIMIKKVDSELNDDNDDDYLRYQLLLKDLSSSSTNALTGR